MNKSKELRRKSKSLHSEWNQKLLVTFEWLNGFLSFKNLKLLKFDAESKNTSKIKLRMILSKNADMNFTFKMLLNLRIRSTPILKMPLIFNFILADNMEEDLKLEKLCLNGHLPTSTTNFQKENLKQTNLQLKIFFLNYYMPLFHAIYGTSDINILGWLSLHRCVF